MKTPERNTFINENNKNFKGASTNYLFVRFNFHKELKFNINFI
jgi:hypothetical protein